MKINALILTASLGLAVTAPAAMMNLNYSGSFGPTTTLNGVPLGGSDNPFSLAATFDPASGIPAGPGVTVFPITALQLHLLSGNYTAAPAPDLNVALGRTSAIYVAGLGSLSLNSLVASIFVTATPPFSPVAPTPSLLSDYLQTIMGANSYTITLGGGAGDLVINDLGLSPFTAELTAAVPEPSQWAMMAVTLLGAGGYGLRRWRNRQAE
jgi:hypothetical protein